jgi:hypothetical protein
MLIWKASLIPGGERVFYLCLVTMTTSLLIPFFYKLVWQIPAFVWLVHIHTELSAPFSLTGTYVHTLYTQAFWYMALYLPVAYALQIEEQKFVWFCWIWGSYGCDYEAYRLLGCNTVWFWESPTFRRNTSSSSSGSKSINETRNQIRLVASWAELLLVSRSSTLKMEVTCFYETSSCRRTTWRYNTEDGIHLSLFVFCISK